MTNKYRITTFNGFYKIEESYGTPYQANVWRKIGGLHESLMSARLALRYARAEAAPKSAWKEVIRREDTQP